MPDLEISNLTKLPEGSVAATDPLPIVDVSGSETKKIEVKDLVQAGVALIDAASIPAAKVGTLGTNQVATAAIQNLAVTTAKIADGAVTAVKIADATITGAKLVNNTITATQIAADAVGASELADDAVDTNAIANLAITNGKIANATITYAKLNITDGDIPGAKINGNSITSAQIAADAIGSSELADNSVDTAAIVNAAVTGAKIATDTIGSGNIAANAVGASELADNAVDTAAIVSNAITTAKIADDQVTAAKLADNLPGTILATGAIGSTQIAANAITDSELANNAVDAGAIASNAVTEAKIAANAVTTTKIADGTITPAKLNTSNLDRSINVASGNLGINNAITAATRSGITYNAQGLITGTVALAASDLPLATTSAVGGVSVGAGLTVSGAGALSITNSVTGATVSGITFSNQGLITGATALVAGDLPVATTSAKGAVQITSGGGLTVDGSGGLTTSTSGISAGTFTKLTVNNKGVATAGTVLAASDIPNLAATILTSGTLDAARIGNDSIDGTKLSNTSTAIFQSIAQSGYPTAQFSGQILFDTVSEDAFIWDGNAWQAITTLTKGSLVFGGTYNANTSKMASTTTAGIAAGLAVGSNLPTPSSTTDGVYVVVDVAGTPSAPAPVVSLSPPDYILGVTNSAGSSWNEIDLSQTVAGQVASNITFTPYGQLSSTNVQDALQELETEKMGLAGGTCTGQLLISNTGSIVFEGSTVDAYELTLAVADPTLSDKTITFPDVTGTLITTGDTNTVTSTMVDGSLLNANIAANAAIALSKLQAVSSAQIIVGNGSNVPTAVAVTGDIGINNAGLTSITAGAIVNADISNSAAITGSKVTTGTTSAVGVLQLTDSAASTSTSTAATPAAVKVAKDAADAAATTANAALPKAGGTMTGNLILDNAKELRLSEGDSDGANYTGLKAQAQSGDITLTLPAVAPTAGQVLKADASTPTTLTWATDAATDSTKMPLAGGTFTGDVTFTGDSSNGLWDKSASAFVANVTGNCSGTSGGFTAGNASNLDSGTVNVARLGSGSSVSTKFLRGDNTWQTISATPEGTAILSTGESGGTKFLREDGDGTCSWQTAITSPAGSDREFQINNNGSFGSTSTMKISGDDIYFYGASKSIYWDQSASALQFAYGGPLNLGNNAYIRADYNGGSGAEKLVIVGETAGTDITGNVSISGTATATTFSGSGANLTNLPAASQVTVANETSDTSCNVLFTTSATGDQAPKSASTLTFNSSNGRLFATTFEGNGSLLTDMTASQITAGTINTARLGSGTASSSTFLRGDGSWQTVGTGTGESYVKIKAGASLADNGTTTYAGYWAGNALAAGNSANTLYGYQAGYAITSGDSNTCIGAYSGLGITTGEYSVCIGYEAGDTITTGQRNIAIGLGTMGSGAVTGSSNIAIGEYAYKEATSGSNNIIIGKSAAQNLTTASTNIGIGTQALNDCTTGTDNIAIGYDAGGSLTTGSDNTFVGPHAGDNVTTGGKNIVIGRYADASSATVNYEATIGSTSITKFRIPGVDFVLKENGGTPSSGQVLTADSNGEGYWATGGVSSDAQRNTVAGTYAGDDFSGTDATGNTLFGYQAGTDITTGDANTAMGDMALLNITTGSNCTAFGYAAAGNCITGEITAVGSVALNNTTGTANVAMGVRAGQNVSSGYANTFIGNDAGRHMATAHSNVAIGYNAMAGNNSASGAHNFAACSAALASLTAGTYNVGIGASALQTCNSGSYNIGIGHQAGYSQTSGSDNVHIGRYAGVFSQGSATRNVYIGHRTGRQQSSSTGSDNVVLGYTAGYNLTSASNNVFLGYAAGEMVTTGGTNNCMGISAGSSITTGSNNLMLGYASGTNSSPSGNVTTGSNKVCLGNNSITHLYCATSSISTSDARDKADVEDFTYGLDWITQLRPVTYRWDRRCWYSDDNSVTPDGSKKKSQINIGFLAQEAIEVEKKFGYATEKDNFLVANQDENMQNPSYGMKYERLVPILVNAIKELSAKIEVLEAK